MMKENSGTVGVGVGFWVEVAVGLGVDVEEVISLWLLFVYYSSRSVIQFEGQFQWVEYAHQNTVNE